MNKLLLILFAVSSLAQATEYQAGEREYSFTDTARSRELKTHVWYPADPKAKVTSSGWKGPFAPIYSAVKGALVKQALPFPVVLISHGSGGLGVRLFWLGEYLAKNGVVSIAVDHPGNKMMDSSAKGAAAIWDRSKDLSFALDRVLETKEFKGRLDRNQVAAAGHSVGGTTVLLLAGARLSHADFTNPTPLCSKSGDPFYEQQCQEFMKLNFQGFPKEVVERDYSDPRVKAVVALDPGFVRSFQKDSLKNLKPKSLVLIAEKLAIPQDEIYSKEFIGLMKPGEAEVVPDSYHMTFMTACKDALPMRNELIELIELCAGNDTRPTVQKAVAEKSLGLFRKAWSNSGKS